MLKQQLKQKLTQRLSPQQIQLMKLLQVPTASLEQRVKEELEVNPALDEGKTDEDEEAPYEEKIDLSDYLSDDLESGYKVRTSNYKDLDDNKTIPIPVMETFHEHLRNQLGMLNLPERKKGIALQIIGSIDDDGYLRRPLDAIIDDLA
ncbi:RNA polymerase sigma-54 factor, partial [Chitinophagales bacterium]|nr:RNA polymerase sigma-54 factor [Chitinophagales bacterium]